MVNKRWMIAKGYNRKKKTEGVMRIKRKKEKNQISTNNNTKACDN